MPQLPTPNAQLPSSLESSRSDFAAEVLRDLQQTPRQLQSQYLYDELGSRLFEAICRLPWYRITRAEERLLDRHVRTLAARVAGRDGPVALVELGVGSGEKLARIVAALPPALRPDVHLIDVSPAALDATSARLSGLDVTIHRHRGTYEEGLRRVRDVVPAGRSTLALFLGSNIGNFDHTAAGALLGRIRRAIGRGHLLLGADLVKPMADLLLAYDDPLGVTAAFNRNLLVRINRELAGDFDVGQFDHRAVWNETAQRIEMHLVSRVAQVVEIHAIGLRVHFEAGERIWTESSYKYTEAGIVALGERAGLTPIDQWIDDEARFALTLFAGVGEGPITSR